MLAKYMLSKMSWILLFISFIGLTDLMIILDQGLQLNHSSLLYLNIVYIIMFIVFFIWRYKRETKLLSSLTKLHQVSVLDWSESIPDSSDELEHEICELLRAASLQSRQVISEIKEAQIIENDFTASWIHEIKTPLTAMKLILEAAQSNPIIRKIETQWLRIHLLVDRQLYITRMPAMESDYVLERVSLKSLAADEIKELALWCIEKNLAINIEGADAIVVTDRKWCRFIIRQILTNAVKYSPPNKSLTFVIGTLHTGHKCLDIVDEGPGIQQHDLPRIFDKGFTGENGRVQNAATGLGLYLARTVANKMGITLIAQVNEAEGTTMRILFTDPNTFESVLRE